MNQTQWIPGRRKLTKNQEIVFRTIFTEELESGQTPAESYTEAERFMREDALPEWAEFWRDWNAPPSPLVKMFEMAAGAAAMMVMLKHASQFSETLGAATKTIFGEVHE